MNKLTLSMCVYKQIAASQYATWCYNTSVSEIGNACLGRKSIGCKLCWRII